MPYTLRIGKFRQKNSVLDPGSDELHTAAKYVGDYLKDHEPDIVVLATPHGINISDSIGQYSD